MNEHDFGRRLRELRHERGETLEQVSAATGLSVAMLSRVERGERLPSPDSVEALASYFGLPVDDLMSDTIATRMRNRYGDASTSKAAERMQGGAEVLRSMAAWDAEGAYEREVREVRGLIKADASAPPDASVTPIADLASMSMPACASGPAPAARSQSVSAGFSARPIEDLFPQRDALDSLADAARVAEVALESAITAARRAMASGDERLAAEGRATIVRLRRALDIR